MSCTGSRIISWRLPAPERVDLSMRRSPIQEAVGEAGHPRLDGPVSRPAEHSLPGDLVSRPRNGREGSPRVLPGRPPLD